VLKIFVIQRYEASLAQTKTVPNPRVAAAGIAEKGRKLTPDLSEQRGLPGKGSACFDLSRNSSAKITILQQFRHTIELILLTAGHLRRLLGTPRVNE